MYQQMVNTGGGKPNLKISNVSTIDKFNGYQ